jgi:hypothetical protein
MGVGIGLAEGEAARIRIFDTVFHMPLFLMHETASVRDKILHIASVRCVHARKYNSLRMPRPSVNQTGEAIDNDVPMPCFALDVQLGGKPGRPNASQFSISSYPEP